MRSLLTDVIGFAARGDKVQVFDEAGNGLIGDARALMVAKFLEGDGTDLIFIDWDVIWPAGTLLKLVDHPVDFVAAMYPQRKDPIEFTVAWIAARKELRADPATGLLEVEGVPFGCVRLKRAMLEAMVKQYTDTEFQYEGAPNNTAWALFDPFRIGRLKFGEDMAFARRWLAMGGKVWIDPEIRMGHIGFKTFVGHLGDFLRARTAPLPAPATGADGIAEVKVSDDAFARLMAMAEAR